MLSWLPDPTRLIGVVGVCSILAIAWLFSSNRRAIKLKLIFIALTMQMLFCLFILKTSVGKFIFQQLARGVEYVYASADAGISFVFGSLAQTNMPWGTIFAIKVLPIIIFFGALMSLLTHIGVVQILVKGVSFVIRPLLGTSGAETLSVAASSILGQTEAPLLIKHYLATMTSSEIMTVMVSGMSHLSGSILAVYGMMGVPLIHLISASIMAIPAAILISKMLMPETDTPQTLGGHAIHIEKHTKNALDALATGTTDGLKLAVNVGAMLITFISLITLVDSLLTSQCGISLNQIFSYIFYPVAYLLGINPGECNQAASLLGQKLVVNEFVAYSSMVKQVFSERSTIILTYAIAGFANFSCIGIQIGGIGALCPTKRELLTRLGFRALLGGTLTNLLNAALVSLVI